MATKPKASGQICRYCKRDRNVLIIETTRRVDAGEDPVKASRCEEAVKAGSFPFHAWVDADYRPLFR